jgi:hypothetical protein
VPGWEAIWEPISPLASKLRTKPTSKGLAFPLQRKAFMTTA